MHSVHSMLVRRALVRSSCVLRPERGCGWVSDEIKREVAHRRIFMHPLGEPLRGVNLGGFLVLEPYLKPQLFQDACQSSTNADGTCPLDEYTLCKALGPDRARKVMHDHWDTFVTFDDLKTLKSSGINALRIPVGYWIVAPKHGEPFVKGGLFYLLRVCEWAGQLGLRVLVELHSAPGLQNNMDHSGHKNHMGWQASQCQNEPSALQTTHIPDSLNVLTKLIEALEAHGHIRPCADAVATDSGGPCGTVFGLGLANEPVSFDKKQPIDYAGLAAYYKAALTQIVPSHLFAVVDIFEGFDWLVQYGILSMHPRLVFDKHRYTGFSEKGMRGALDPQWLYQFACAAMSDGFDLKNASAVASARGESMAPLVFGEWSVAVNDCMPWIGGAFWQHTNYECCGVSPDARMAECARTPGGRNPSSWAASDVQLRRGYAERQMVAMEGSGSLGWFYWNFKTIPASEWSYLDGLAYGFVPRVRESVGQVTSTGVSTQRGASSMLCADDPGALPVYCTATDPACDMCLARNGHNATCAPWPPAAPAVPAPSCVKPTAQPQSMLMQQSATLSSMSALAPASTHFPDGMLLVALVLVIAVLTLTVRAWMRGRRHERRCLPHRHAALVRTTSELSGENDFMECDGYVAFDALRPPAVPQ